MKISLWQFTLALTVIGGTLGMRVLPAQDQPQRDGPWLNERTAEGLFVQTAELTLTPAAEPKPALKVRLLPDNSELIEANSALYYLKAMGFIEQRTAAKKLQQFIDQQQKVADERGVTSYDVPPLSWQDMTPADLPLDEVKEYLSITAFQPAILAEATRRSGYSLDRDLRHVPSPIAYLLPEIQQMRDLARLQSLRLRVALREQRMDDALTILKQQFTMARHLGSDEFVVSNLVGAATLGMALQDLLYVLDDPHAPNLYWAIANLPSPMIDMNRALSFERQFMSMQLKAISEVDEQPRPAGYWQDFVDRILPQMRELDLRDARWMRSSPELERPAFVTVIAAAYPGAKRYLIEECGLDRAKVDAYPTAQTVFLAMKRFNERMVDEHFKWFGPAYHQAVEHPAFKGLDEILETNSHKLGWAGLPTKELLTYIQGIRAAQNRPQQLLALLQIVEGIRMHAASHAGKLPATLDELTYPVPMDPISGEPSITN